jgi:hypothetical protein
MATMSVKARRIVRTAFLFYLLIKHVPQLQDAVRDLQAVEGYFAMLTARRGHEFFVTTCGARAHAI